MIEGIHWKFVAVTSVIAMAVSLLSGGLSGIRFGMLLIRALIGGVLFGVLAVGLNILMKRFFPEIFEGETTFIAESDETEIGKHVDIVMPAENPEPSVSDAEANSSESTGEEDEKSGITKEEERNDSAIDSESSEEENVGVIGDLDKFSADFSDVEDDSAKSSRSVSEVMGVETDAQEIAQAIQTVIKREKKG